MGIFVTNDDVTIYYEDIVGGGDEDADLGPPLILIHGWSGSSQAFCKNMRALAKCCTRVVAVDLRSHGQSQKVSYGFHVSRLAMDINNLLEHLQLNEVIMLGSSLGCAVIWSFVELFGCNRLRAAIFVDQAPFQNSSMDGAWRAGSKGIFGPQSLGWVMGKLSANKEAFMRGNVEACMTRVPTESDINQFGSIAMQADTDFLINLMCDHTSLDWRKTLPRIMCKTLVVGCGASKIFPLEGVQECAKLMPNSTFVCFEGGSHWIYYESPQEFNELIINFLQGIL